jgi:hypothetical protein
MWLEMKEKVRRKKGEETIAQRLKVVANFRLLNQ